jgi:hypothetical protein
MSVDLAVLLRPYRAVFVLLLSLLLVGMQQEAFRHALTHFRPAPAHQQLSNSQADAPCVECALLAGGSTALLSAALVLSASRSAYVAALPAPSAPTLARLSFYRSRAPPSLS